MKIALIATEKLPVPAIRGGAIQIYLERVAPLLAKNHDVTVFSITDSNLSDRENSNGVSYIRFEEHDYLEKLMEHFKENSFDVIHLCNRPKWITHLKSAAPNARLILSVHNDMFAFDKISDQEGLECINTLSSIATVSDYIGNTITSRFPEAKSKTRTVYSGVDMQEYVPHWTNEGKKIRESIRNQLGLQNKKVILFVGRLSKVKGPHLLLQALPEITAKHPDAVMVFVGSKWFGEDGLNNYVKHLYTLGSIYKDHVTFIKFVKPRDIPGLYTMSDLFVCSSQWQEPLARVHYEAMAAGLPIITSNRGGNPEVIIENQNGKIIHQFDHPEAYANTINSLLSDENKRRKMGQAGRIKAEKEFGWERVAANLSSLYTTASNGVIGGNRHGA